MLGDPSDAVEALLGLSGALYRRDGVDGEMHICVVHIGPDLMFYVISFQFFLHLYSLASAKRKYDSFTAGTPLIICQLCRNQYEGETLNNFSLPAYCDTCSKRLTLTTNLLYPGLQGETRSCSPVQEIYLGLHGLEVAEAAMACLGSFLTATERVLFGVAIDPTGPSRAGEMVTGKSVTELDFVDIDAQLAARLNDDHLQCILMNIDAKHNLKVLKLTHCTGISGTGLEPIRDSQVLQLIDVSLMKLHETPKTDPQTLLSEAMVLPVLDSILHQGEQSALVHVQFHKNWKERSSPWFRDFMSRYEKFLNTASRQLCALCHTSSPKGSNCYLCLDYVCNECMYSATHADQATGQVTGSHCTTCEKSFCCRCVEFQQCQADNCMGCCRDHCIECTTGCTTCNLVYCMPCNDLGRTCDGCGNRFCGSFQTNCLGEHCLGCNKSFCDNCVEFDFCSCGEAMCDSCISDKCNH